MSTLSRKIPFLRWSFIRLFLGMPHLLKNWQVGDGREARLAEYVVAKAKQGDAKDVIRIIDEYCYNESFLINVGDEKGLILDAAVERAKPSRILELGTYCGYSALRMAAAAPTARIVSIEFNAENAKIARRIFEHAGVSSRVTVVVGTLGDGGKTASALNQEQNFAAGTIDLVFVDHDKNAYLPDLKLIMREGWLRRGGLVVADNIKFPGAPEYRAYMHENEGKVWRTDEYETHAEYQTMIKDLVLVSEYLA
ncbi:O-methyltransferase [Stenotrophobium rhamnosiphilum]|uniref:SAM-dependent methyltransferase n=1 Tax=Stenotrophobium rhamnosiphilum TaxID=2029166 RepID=A0A2T5MFL8_9GAMM|nr:O-methyltransferase [Stenotrophobium rhamnosiphilum]PTU31371.1 SAM-dependent methyltransferase [Stenotrophobium rhamnosiphilum]